MPDSTQSPIPIVIQPPETRESQSTSQNTAYVKARCHCGLNELRVGFNTSRLPISNGLCHCNSCRHSSGQMSVYHVPVDSLLCADSDEPFHVGPSTRCDGDGDLVAYQTSKSAVRYSCVVCSAQLLFHHLGSLKDGSEEDREEGEYMMCVAAGALEKVEGIVQPGYHIHVEDTRDGGLADHLIGVDGVYLKRYSRGRGTEELPLGWKHEGLLHSHHSTNVQKPDAQARDRLRFSCHCNTIRFSVTRPTQASTIPYAAYPDLLYPHDVTHLAKLRNHSDEKWWLRPAAGSPKLTLPTKYLAGHCACDNCRLTSGFEIQSWAYVPLANIVDENGRPFALVEDGRGDLDEVRAAVDKLALSDNIHLPPREEGSDGPSRRPAGLKQYITSPGRYREFCSKCGATAFAWQAGRPDLVCVAVALVDESQAGARAEGWFEWCLTRVGYAEEAVGTHTVEGLTAGLHAIDAVSKSLEAAAKTAIVSLDELSQTLDGTSSQRLAQEVKA